MIKVLYFGQIADQLGREADQFDFEVLTVADFHRVLLSKHSLKGVLFSIAINQKIVDKADTSLLIRSMDEVAILPPFAGG